MGDIPRPDWSGRLRQVWRHTTAPAGRLVVTNPVNIRYLCGFDGSAGLLLASNEETWLVIDSRYGQATQAARDVGAIARVRIRVASQSLDDALAELLVDQAVPDVAFEADSLTVGRLTRWQESLPDCRFVASSGWIEELRAVKDGAELAAIREACRRVAEVARELPRWVASGRTERAVAGDIDDAMRRAGLEGPAFPTIVASGPNSALPHARPTERALGDGDLVVLDFGGALGGYCGDLTRTAGVGRVGAEARRLFETVRAAQGAALAAVRAEVPAHEVDAAARQICEARGLGQGVLHATGHGLGLEVHEAPRLGRPLGGRVERLEAGMVCTIEPGVYVDGVGGVRLEDDVVVTATGYEMLTDAPRDLLLV